jgi:hypothetical protein
VYSSSSHKYGLKNSQPLRICTTDKKQRLKKSPQQKAERKKNYDGKEERRYKYLCRCATFQSWRKEEKEGIIVDFSCFFINQFWSKIHATFLNKTQTKKMIKKK